MAEVDFSDLIPKAAPGGGVSFDDLIPKSASDQSVIPDAIRDIPSEVGSAMGSALQHATGNSVPELQGYDPRTRGQLGPVEGLMRTGRQIAAVPETIFAVPLGIARSVGGHVLADVTHKIGEFINPEVAAKDDRQKMYETAKGDIDLALSAARPAGSPVKTAPRLGPATTIENGAGRTAIQTGERPAYEWQSPPPKAPTAQVPTVEELKQAASAGYQSPEIVGLEIKPTAIKSYADQARLALNEAGIDEVVAPKTFGVLAKLDKVPEGAVSVSGQNINSLRKTLANAAGSLDPVERLAAKRAIDALDEFLPNLSKKDVIAGDAEAASKIFEDARGNYAAAARSQTIDKKTVQAELRAAASNSGQNVANTVRQRMADILINPAERRGYSPEELGMMEQIVRGSHSQNAMRIAGNVLGGGGGLGSVVSAGIGAAATGGPGAVAPLIGFALKALGNRLSLRQAEKLSEAIRSRSPLASSMSKFNESAAALKANRTPQTIAGFVLSTRNLSTNLQGAGFNISPADLLRAVQGDAPARAEDEK